MHPTTLDLRRGLVLGILLTCVLLLAPAAAAQGCGDAERAQYLEDAQTASADELAEIYAFCEDDTAPPPSETSPLKVTAATKTVDNSIGSVFYEQLNSCGYHPQGEIVTCDVEVKRTTYYGPFPGGSNEYVRFCFDCNSDGFYEGNTVGIVHVTDNNFNTNPNPNPSWYFNAYASTWQFCPQNDGTEFRVRAILSWASDPGPGACNVANPPVIWGNQIFFTARRDP